MLTEEQINRLYKFCVQHYVRYYDVQMELVDHLANAIEARMEADKKLDFETVLHSVYTGFGVMGFSRIVSQRTEVASKQIWKTTGNIFASILQYRGLRLLFYSSVFLLFCIFR